MDRKAHWQQVFTTNGERDVSWFEMLPAMSLQMMESAGLGPDTCVLDVGGGDSRLVDVLASRGLDCLAVLDVSGAALHRAQERLGELAGAFTWIESDVIAPWSLKPMDIWHDRAVFHFLTTAAERATYRTSDQEARRRCHRSRISRCTTPLSACHAASSGRALPPNNSRASDWLTTTALALTALVASWLPARAATRVDPLKALQADGQ
jgi:hypothetical protein